MKAMHSMIAALALTLVLPAPADTATTDPEVIIYRFPGVTDNGQVGFLGVATATNFSGVDENVRFVTRHRDGNLLSNVTVNVGHLATVTIATHEVGAYIEHLLLSIGPIFQGTTAIAATSINIICTAMTIDASTAVPVGVALRGIRFSPVPGSQE